ncbi:hypothetical protein LTR49_025542 [Elasticomyces elasticus]|nr:hypothetical protein LTR49_025542 [Elasticomyces elasticus]
MAAQSKHDRSEGPKRGLQKHGQEPIMAELQARIVYLEKEVENRTHSCVSSRAPSCTSFMPIPSRSHSRLLDSPLLSHSRGPSHVKAESTKLEHFHLTLDSPGLDDIAVRGLLIEDIAPDKRTAAGIDLRHPGYAHDMSKLDHVSEVIDSEENGVSRDGGLQASMRAFKEPDETSACHGSAVVRSESVTVLRKEHGPLDVNQTKETAGADRVGIEYLETHQAAHHASVNDLVMTQVTAAETDQVLSSTSEGSTSQRRFHTAFGYFTGAAVAMGPRFAAGIVNPKYQRTIDILNVASSTVVCSVLIGRTVQEVLNANVYSRHYMKRGSIVAALIVLGILITNWCLCFKWRTQRGRVINDQIEHLTDAIFIISMAYAYYCTGTHRASTPAAIARV